MKAIHLIMHGRVQGVGFRAWFAGQAKKHELDGWVRNLTDGTVEAVISGDEVQMEKMIKAAHKGPLAAKVRQLEQSDIHELPPKGFEKRDTL